MTIFSRYYNTNKKLISVSMKEIEDLIKDETNKEVIAEYLFHRFYERFIKPFDYNNEQTDTYSIEKGIITKNIFNTEFKSGFLMMSSACILIENISGFLQGKDKTYGKGDKHFNMVFLKCKEYNNPLKIFHDEKLYKNIRNGLLHQGETYDNFKINRKGELFNKKENRINATKFVENITIFLKDYKEELINADWDSQEWINCRAKITSIIENTK